MIKAIKRIAKRIFIFILILFAIYLVISNIDLIRDLATKEKINVVIDADVANGSDDIFAILRIMVHEDVELRGLLSAQWRLADLENDSTVSSNQFINTLILDQFHKAHIRHKNGAALPLAYSQDKDNNGNEASAAIIRTTTELPYGEKLNMLCLGSATNLAGAILEKPDIADKIICYIQGPYYDPSRRAWDKSDPVTRLDLEAMDVLMNDDNLEIHLLPANVASELILNKNVLLEELTGTDTLVRFIKDRSISGHTETDTLELSSLALVQAFLNADMSTQKQLIAPPENHQRKIYVYTRIDADRMTKDFIKSLAGKFNQHN
jgi:purine nucleosidase